MSTSVSQNAHTHERVVAYVDGFNLYYGLRDKHWRRYYWLNVHDLIRNLLASQQTLVKTRYFTSRLKGWSAAKHTRQTNYIEALESIADIEIDLGNYLKKKRRCSQCGKEWEYYEEKMTDVNIAVRLLEDAQDDNFDTAIVVSADSDLTSPISSILNRYSNKRVVVAFPPGRRSGRLARVASATIAIGRKVLSDSQLKEKIKKPNGTELVRPNRWK